MAAITAPTVDSDCYGGVFQGAKLRAFNVTTNAASTSTWASGIDGIIKTAWAGNADTDFVVPTVSGSTITFTNSAASAFSGILYVWSES